MNNLAKRKVIEKRERVLREVLKTLNKYDGGLKIDNLVKVTKFSETEVIQALAIAWAFGLTVMTDKETKKKFTPKNKKSADDIYELKKLAMEEGFENEAEMTLSVIEYLPASTFEELGIMTGLGEHNLCLALLWLNKNGEIFEDDGLFFSEHSFNEKVA
jgi:hypothetical protein